MLVITIVNKNIHHILKMRFPSEDLNIQLSSMSYSQLSLYV